MFTVRKYFSGKGSKHRSANLSIIISSAAFALSHLSNLSAVSKKAVFVQMIGALIIGMLLGLITIKTESLLSAVVLHAINDIASAYAIIVLNTGKTAFDIINSYGFWDFIAMLPILIYLICLSLKQNKSQY